VTWNEDYAEETLENHSSQEHQDQGFEEERSGLEKER
jgi:hypothetical protein